MGLLIRHLQGGFLTAAVFPWAAVINTIFLFAVSPLAAASSYPERIVSLGPINTENVFLLGAGKRLIADTVYCVRPEEARHRIKIGTIMEINIEKIVALRPDLVLATALTQPAQIQKLKECGLRVIRFPKPVSFEAVCSQFLKLGKLLGLEQKAVAVLNEVRREVKCIKYLVSSYRRRKVLLQVGADPIFVSVPGSFMNDYIRFAGGINIADDQSSGLFSLEKAVALNPDTIIIAIMGTEAGRAAREQERWMKFKTITAVKMKRVYTINPDILCSPSPCTFAAGLRKIVSLIHPEAARHFVSVARKENACTQ